MTAPPDVQQLLAHEPFVRALAQQLLADDPEELVQATFVRALAARGAAVIRSPRAFLARIAHHAAANLRRSAARRRRHEQAGPLPSIVPSSAELVEREERRQRLVAAVDALPDALRAVVWLRFFEAMPARRVAQELDIAVDTVFDRQRQALALLRRRLDAEHVDRRAFLAPLLPAAWSGAAAATSLPLLLMSAQTKLLLAAGLLGLAITGYCTWLAPGHLPDTPAAPTGAAVQGDTGPEPARAAAERQPAAEAPAPTERRAEVDAAWVVAGRVESAEQQPAPRVAVLAEVFRGFTTDGKPEHRADLRSDAAGRVRLPLARPDHSVTLRLRVADPGHLPGTPIERAVPVGRPAPQDLVLRADPLVCTVSGRVVDQADRGIADARVFANRRVIRSGADGTFTLQAPGWSSYQLCVVADGYGITYTSVQLGVPGARGTVTVRLQPARRATGRVVGEDHLPIAGAQVTSLMADSWHATQTGADGAFTVDWLDIAQRRHVLLVRKPGFAPKRVPLESTLTAPQEIVLAPSPTLSGRVLAAASGAPVPGATVRFDDQGPFQARTVSDDTGAFTLGDLTPGSHQLRVEAPGFAPHDALVKVSTGANTGHDIALTLLADSGRIGGTVVDGSGAALAGASLGVTSGSGRMSKPVKTDANGHFTVDGLTSESVHLHCSKRGYLSWHSKVVVGREDLRIALSVAGFAAGRVIDSETGAPIERFRIYETAPRLQAGERAGISLGFGITGKDIRSPAGEWHSKYGNAPGNVLGVLVVAPGYAPGIDRRVVLRADPTPDMCIVKLQRGSTVRGQVRDADGKPVAKATIRAISGDRPPRANPFVSRSKVGSVVTDEDGGFALRDAPVGTVTLVIEHAKWPLTTDGPFTVSSGQTMDRSITMPRSAVVEGVLRGPDGKPVSGVELQLADESQERGQRTTTDTEGRFRFDHQLAAGNYTLVANPFRVGAFSHVALGTRFAVEAGRTHTMQLAPPGRCTLHVEIPAAGGKDIYVHLARLRADGKTDRTPVPQWLRVRGGNGELEGLPVGRYRIQVNADVGRGDFRVEVRGGGTDRVTLDLQPPERR